MCYRKVIMGLICICSQDHGSREHTGSSAKGANSFVPIRTEPNSLARNSTQPRPSAGPASDMIRCRGECHGADAASPARSSRPRPNELWRPADGVKPVSGPSEEFTESTAVHVRRTQLPTPPPAGPTRATGAIGGHPHRSTANRPLHRTERERQRPGPPVGGLSPPPPSRQRAAPTLTPMPRSEEDRAHARQ